MKLPISRTERESGEGGGDARARLCCLEDAWEQAQPARLEGPDGVALEASILAFRILRM